VRRVLEEIFPPEAAVRMRDPDQTEVEPLRLSGWNGGRAIDFRNDNGSIGELLRVRCHPPVSVQPSERAHDRTVSESRANTSFKTQGEPWHGMLTSTLVGSARRGSGRWLGGSRIARAADVVTLRPCLESRWRQSSIRLTKSPSRSDLRGQAWIDGVPGHRINV